MRPSARPRATLEGMLPGESVRAWRRLRGEEEGVALVLALLVMLVLTIMLTGVIYITAAGARDAHRSNAGQRAYSLAESGINNALSVLEANYPGTVGYPGDNTLLTTCPQSLPTVCAFTSTYPTGSVSWSGTLDNSPPGLGWSDQWNITATATAANPTGPSAAPVTRTVKVVVPVVKPTVTPVGQNNPLNFIYGDTVDFQQSVKIASPVYAIDDLKLENGAAIDEFIGQDPASPNKAAVGGDFYAEQNADTAGHVEGNGSPANDLGEMHIQGRCSTKSNAALHPCVWGSTDQIWARNTDPLDRKTIPSTFLDYVPKLTCCSPYAYHAPLAPLEAARSSMGEAYRTADLGPLSPCASGSLPAAVFPNQFDTASGAADNDINNSATPAGSAAINLTPSTSYSCTARNGSALSWDSSQKRLRVQGTIFVDGSATITSSPAAGATVTGQGTLFLTGTFMMKNALLCVKTTGTGNNTQCDTSPGSWNPNNAALIIVAEGDGGYDSTEGQSHNVVAGQGINIKSSDFQGALIANKDIGVDTTSRMQGPMVSVYHTVNAGQSGVLTFPPILFAPSGESLLGPPPVPQLLSPRQFGGG